MASETAPKLHPLFKGTIRNMTAEVRTVRIGRRVLHLDPDEVVVISGPSSA